MFTERWHFQGMEPQHRRPSLNVAAGVARHRIGGRIGSQKGEEPEPITGMAGLVEP